MLQSIQTDVANLMINQLSPFLGAMITICRFVGIGMIAVGLGRLHRHGHHHMMHRISPVSTVMYFVSGTVLASFMPELTAFSLSMAGSYNANNMLLYNCSADVAQTGRQFCPMLAYAHQVQTHSGDVNTVLKSLAFALLTLVGIFSFVKGFTILVKLGEGHQQSTLSRAVTHIVAGIVGINAGFFYGVFNSIFQGL